MDILEKLFTSGGRVKIMRFFLVNPEEIFTLEEISKTLRLPRSKSKKEINFLKSIGFLAKGAKEVQLFFKKTKKARKKKELGFRLNKFFPYIRQLRSLVSEAPSASRELFLRRFRQLGRGLRLIILSGVFVANKGERTLDVLIVCDNPRKGPVEKILSRIESEMGKELNYALLSTEEYKYRCGMYDKFITEILENDHDVLIDRMNA
ncbi:hypothetical protein HYW53_02720 [Candidatus Giovannonibacteria bacterium]|nr:hypothetical protein [Candidatus Giovannonibacteria bacterium]